MNAAISVPFDNKGFDRLFQCVAGDDMLPVYGQDTLESGRAVDYWMLAEHEASAQDADLATLAKERVGQLGRTVTMLGFMDEGRYSAVSRVGLSGEGELTIRVAHQEAERGRPLDELSTFRLALAAAVFETPITNPKVQTETFDWMVRIARLITGREV